MALEDRIYENLINMWKKEALGAYKENGRREWKKEEDIYKAKLLKLLN